MSQRTVPQALNPSGVVVFGTLVLATTFALSCWWEYGLEQLIFESLSLPYEPGHEDEARLRFILTSTGFAAMSLILPCVVLALLVRRLNRANHKLFSAQAETAALARFDPLTGLVNRRVFSDELKRLCGPGGTEFALFLIDMDDFKSVNDLFGHAAGDAVLCATASRLTQILHDGGIAARLGGDEFAALLPCDSSGHEVPLLAERLAQELAKPIEFGGEPIAVSASLGVALRRGSDKDDEAVLRSADIALYRAKREGHGTFRFFEQRMEAEIEDRRRLEDDIRRSVRDGRFKPYFQPLIRFSDSNLHGFEVLARWDHPERGLLPPAAFVGVAEELGLISDLTLGVLRQACLAARDWAGAPTLSVNVSPTELKDLSLALRIMTVLNDTGFPPRRLEIEITESAVMTNVDCAENFIAAVRAVGMSVALDDFGTGYSSLSKLQQLKFDKIKIDRSFVAAAEQSPDGRALVNMIVALGRSLNVETTAEGIETSAIAARLARKGCTYGQGYFFGRPMPEDEAQRFARDGAAGGPPAAAVS
jgi:diguanylate cyclase (GGDEF)-like protein